jgi:tetratricopeptide (TPR) repeat protein
MFEGIRRSYADLRVIALQAEAHLFFGVATQTDLERRPKLVDPVFNKAVGLTSSSTRLKHLLHGVSGRAHELLERFPQSHTAFDTAVELLPPEGDLYDIGPALDEIVAGYLRSLQYVSHFPKEKQGNLYETAIERMGKLMPRLPEHEYTLEGHTGMCYDRLNRRLLALPHHERGLLLHPDDEKRTDIAVYRNNYLTDVRSLLQSTLPQQRPGYRPRKSPRPAQAGIPLIADVTNSTFRVLEQFPDDEEIRHEHTTSFEWLLHAVGPNKVKLMVPSPEVTRN